MVWLENTIHCLILTPLQLFVSDCLKLGNPRTGLRLIASAHLSLNNRLLALLVAENQAAPLGRGGPASPSQPCTRLEKTSCMTYTTCKYQKGANNSGLASSKWRHAGYWEAPKCVKFRGYNGTGGRFQYNLL